MGYFRRRIDRGRARAELERLDALGQDDRPWEALPAAARVGARYVRFSILEQNGRSRRRTGIFVALHGLLASAELDPALRERLREELIWFTAYLDSPDVVDERAVFFFKADARECMDHAWAIVYALRDAGCVVEMQAIEQPGRIVHEDEHQVAAVPWSDGDVR